MKEFELENISVHKDLEISDDRDEELRQFMIDLITKTNSVSEFLLGVEESELSLREKLYVSAQFGRFYSHITAEDDKRLASITENEKQIENCSGI